MHRLHRSYIALVSAAFTLKIVQSVFTWVVYQSLQMPQPSSVHQTFFPWQRTSSDPSSVKAPMCTFPWSYGVVTSHSYSHEGEGSPAQTEADWNRGRVVPRWETGVSLGRTTLCLCECSEFLVLKGRWRRFAVSLLSVCLRATVATIVIYHYWEWNRWIQCRA